MAAHCSVSSRAVVPNMFWHGVLQVQILLGTVTHLKDHKLVKVEASGTHFQRLCYLLSDWDPHVGKYSLVNIVRLLSLVQPQIGAAPVQTGCRVVGKVG